MLLILKNNTNEFKDKDTKTKKCLAKKLLILIVFLIFGWSAQKWIDPDFGWHYRLGQIITSTGIPKTDPFSFTMPSYPYVDHEWILNIIYFYLYENFNSFYPLAILHALVATACPFVVLAGINKNKKRGLELIIISLVWSTFFPRFGIRPQVFSWLFLSILIHILFNKKKRIQTRWILPILFSFWSNMHGSYILGIGLLALYVGTRTYNNKKIKYYDYMALVLSFFSTLINPYGLKLWEELLRQMIFGANLRRTILEWMPSFLKFEIGFFAISVFTSVLMFINRKRILLFEKIILIGAIFFGTYSSRNTPLAVLLLSSLFIKYANRIREISKNIEYGGKRFNIFARKLALTSLFMLTISAPVHLQNTVLSVNENNYYPKGAAEFLKTDGKNKNVFADYNYGGYLIWKAPNNKYFVDGRMDVLFWQAPKGESNYAFKEYLEISCGQVSIAEITYKYKIDLFVVSKIQENQTKNPFEPAIDAFKTLLVSLGFLYCKEQINIAEELRKTDWVKVYEDDKVEIYEKQKPELEKQQANR
mgnify:CR=1 FL=1